VLLIAYILVKITFNLNGKCKCKGKDDPVIN